jgi:hypothetical protein
MEQIRPEKESTHFQVCDAADCLARLSKCAFSARLERAGVMFAQIRLQLTRISTGIPVDDSGWLSLANLISQEWREMEESHGKDRS